MSMHASFPDIQEIIELRRRIKYLQEINSFDANVLVAATTSGMYRILDVHYRGVGVVQTKGFVKLAYTAV